MNDQAKIKHRREITIFLFFFIIIILIVWLGVLYSRFANSEQTLADLEVLCELEKDLLWKRCKGEIK